MKNDLVNLTIDGIPVQAPAGTTVLLAAKASGIDIPTLCYHPELKPEGHCRLCVVEIGEAPRTRLVNSCTYPVEAGLVVQTASEKVLASRRMVLELLLAQAPAAEIIQGDGRRTWEFTRPDSKRATPRRAASCAANASAPAGKWWG